MKTNGSLKANTHVYIYIQYISYTNTHSPHTHALTKIGPGVGAFNDGMFTRVIQDRSLG